MGDSFGDVGDEGVDVGVLRKSLAICADVGVPYLAMYVSFSLVRSSPCFRIGGVAHAAEVTEIAHTGGKYVQGRKYV